MIETSDNDGRIPTLSLVLNNKNMNELENTMSCSYCNELLSDMEEEYFNAAVHEMPLCTECMLNNW